MKNVLKVENVTMQFGGVVAVDNLNMEVNEARSWPLIGPNGAGKTTAFNVITGVYAPHQRPGVLQREVHRAQSPHRQDEKNLQG